MTLAERNFIIIFYETIEIGFEQNHGIEISVHKTKRASDKNEDKIENRIVLALIKMTFA